MTAIAPGKVRALEQMTNNHGIFAVCAMDHSYDDLGVLLSEDSALGPFDRKVDAKRRVIEALVPSSSSVLLDPEMALAQSIHAGIVPRDVGIAGCVEDWQLQADGAGYVMNSFRPGWSVAQLSRSGAAAAKTVVFYRPDMAEETRRAQESYATEFIRQCDDHGLMSIVEPIWQPLPGETVDEDRRGEDIVAGAKRMAELKPDVLKLQFPGTTADEAQRDAGHRRCEAITGSVPMPWVLLSAGVGYAAFIQQLEMSCSSGASGFMAGRVLWREFVSEIGKPGQAEAHKSLVERMEEMTEMANRLSRPWWGSEVGSGLRKVAVPEGWYRDSSLTAQAADHIQ